MGGGAASAPPARDIVAEAETLLGVRVASGSAERGQRFLALVESANGPEAQHLLGALARGGPLAQAFHVLASPTRTRALVDLERRSRSAPLGGRATGNAGTDDPGTANRGIQERGTANRGIDDRSRGIEDRGIENRGLSSRAAGFTPYGPHNPDPLAPRQSVPPDDGWEDLAELFDPSASADIQALVAEVRVTPRLVRQFAWGELQAYLALSLRKARSRGPGVGAHIKVGPQELDQALTSVTKVALLKIKGLTFAETGITAGNGSFTLAFNLKANPLFPLCIETKWAQLITHQHRFPGFDMSMDFEAQFIVEILPSLDTLKHEAGRAIYYMQRIAEWAKSGAAREWGRGALRSAIRRLNAAGTNAHRALARALQASGRAGARAGSIFLRGVSVAAKLVQMVELPFSSALALAEVLAYIGEIHRHADENTVQSFFLGGYVQMFHAMAVDSHPERAVDDYLVEGIPTITLASVDFEAKKLDVEKIVSEAPTGRRNFAIDRMNCPMVFENCRKIYQVAAERGAFGRGAAVRDAITSMLRVAGRAAAFQEFLAFVATQTFLRYEEDPRRGTVRINQQFGLESWKRLSAVYQEYLVRRAEAASREIPRHWQYEDDDTARFLRAVYRETGGFPMLPEPT